MFILPGAPSTQADVHELADFAEILSLKNKRVSAREIVAYLGRIDDNDHNIGCEDDDDENADILDETMNEIDRREKACGTGYPFQLESSGAALHYRNDTDKNFRSIVYLYLLLSTRLNMNKSKKHVNIDGALLLEELSAHVLKNYLGSERAKSLVFGTSSSGKFGKKVDALCVEIREGGRFRNIDPIPTKAKDGKLDAVAWVPFLDCLPGQLVIFGQCKTGSTWQTEVHQLRPEGFIKKWMQEPFIVDPIRAFCISEAANRSHWKEMCTDTGILFDRCRLVDFSDKLDRDLFERIAKWTKAVMDTIIFDFTNSSRRRSSRKAS